MANTQSRSLIYSLFAVIAILCVSNIALADLVAYWTFNDYANGTLLSATTDSSGNGFTVSNVGDANYRPFISSSNQLYGNHLQRNNATAESKSNCNITAANVYTGNMTISYWGTQPTTNWRNYITLRTESTGEEFQFQKANNGMVVYKTNNKNQNATSMVGNSSLSLGTAWHHFVVTVDSSTQKAYMYIDGALISETTWTHNQQITNLTFNGAWNFGGRGSDANLDEVQIYNQSMTAQQVQFLYNNPSLYQATVYQRNVTANGNWSDADWNANGQTGQTFANSSAVQLDATNSPTLTVDQNVTVNSIDFNGSMTVDGSNTITLNGEKRITVANAADTATISAPITAQYDNGITKTGEGTLKLSGTNTHTGGTTVTGGTLAVTNVNALGSGDVTLNGGTLDASGAGVKNFSNAIVIGSNGGTVTTATADYSSFASISGSGDLTTNGLVHFNGTGAYSGNVTVNSGYLRINPGAFGVIDLTINSGGHFNILNSGTVQIGKLNSTADVEVFGSTGSNKYTYEIGTGTTSSDTASFAGYIRGSSNGAYNVTIKKVGEGTQTFCRAGYGYASPANSLKEVIVNGGKMIIDASHGTYTADHTVGYWGTAPITINSGATLEYKKSWTTSPNILTTVNGGTLTLSAYQYVNKLTLNSGTVNGTSEIRVGYNGAGVWNVTGGTSTVDLKIVTVRTNDYNKFTINIADGAMLDIKKNIVGLTDDNSYKGTNLVVNGSGTTGSQGAGTIKFNPASGVITKDIGTISFNNVLVELAGDAGWLQNGYFNGSAVTLTNSTMTTNTDHTTNATVFTLDGSTLKFNGVVNSYAYQIKLKNGSTIGGTTADSSFRTGHEWNSQIITVYDSGQPENVMNTISADIAMFNTGRKMTFDIADKAPLTISGSFVPAANGHYNALVKTGAGTLTLTGQNSYSTTTISEGKLVVSGNGTLGTSDVTIAQNATLEFAPDSVQNVSNAISGAGAVIKSGFGTLTLTNAPGYTGATTVESGTLALSAGGTLYNLSGEGDVNYGANALTLSNSAATTFDGDILGSGTVTKDGTGTLTLSKAPGYTGATNVQLGTLALAQGGTLYNLTGGSLDDNGNVVAFIDASGKDLTLSNSELSKFIGSITAAKIEKTDDGTMQIYTGANGQVDAQSLVVSSGRMDLKGYMTHNITVDANVVFSPGNSVGEARFGGDYELKEGATLLIEIGKDEDDNIVADRLIVDGNAMFESGSIINITLDDSSTLKGGDTFSGVIITASNAESIFDSVQKAITSYYFTDIEVTRDGNNILLSATLDANAVPEPSTWALLILGVVALLLRKRVSK